MFALFIIPVADVSPILAYILERLLATDWVTLPDPVAPDILKLDLDIPWLVRRFDILELAP